MLFIFLKLFAVHRWTNIVHVSFLSVHVLFLKIYRGVILTQLYTQYFWIGYRFSTKIRVEFQFGYSELLFTLPSGRYAVFPVFLRNFFWNVLFLKNLSSFLTHRLLISFRNRIVISYQRANAICCFSRCFPFCQIQAPRTVLQAFNVFCQLGNGLNTGG